MRLMRNKGVNPAQIQPPITFSSCPFTNYHPQAHVGFCCSVTQSCPTLCEPMDCSMPGFLFHHQLLKLAQFVSIEWVIPSNHLILCCPLLLPPSTFPSIRVFSSQFFASGGQSIGVSASTSVLSMTIQDGFPLGWTGWISLQSKGLSRVFSNTTV